MKQITRATTLRFPSHQARGKLIDTVANGASGNTKMTTAMLRTRLPLLQMWSRKPFFLRLFFFLNKISIFMGEGDLLTKNRYLDFYSVHRHRSAAPVIRSMHISTKKKFFRFQFFLLAKHRSDEKNILDKWALACDGDLTTVKWR